MLYSSPVRTTPQLPRPGRPALFVLLAALSTTPACKENKMAKIEAVRDGALIGPESIGTGTMELSACKDPDPAKGAEAECLATLAGALGSKNGFHAVPADQASAATVAILVGRDKLGYAVPRAEAWLDLMKSGKGPGVDALRLAVVGRMVLEAATVGQKTEDEAVARKMMASVARTIPGACPTYALLGAGKENDTLAPELRAEHSACVQKHLSLRDGPGSRYGAGIFRATEGAMALWRETERAVRLGLDRTEGKVHDKLVQDLAVVEAATLKIGLKRDPSTIAADTMERLGEAHAEAGVPIWKPKDAGAKDATKD